MLPLTYAIVTSPVKGAPTIARAVCNSCKEPGEIHIQANRRHNPEMIAKLFRAEGWKFDHNRQRKCICAACTALKHPRHNTEEHEMKTPAAAAPLAQMGAIFQPKVRDTPEAEKPYHGIVPPPLPVPKLPVQARDLTPAQKTKVRQMLDGHFDEAKGMYLEGYSDQRIGKELNLPWACVQQMREAAYGPILVDTEVETLRSKVKELNDKMNLSADRLLKAENMLKDERLTLQGLRQEGLALFEIITHLSTARKAS